MESDAWATSPTDRKPKGVIGQYYPRSSNNYAEVRGRERYMISTWVSPGFFAGAPLMQPTGMADTSRYSWACEISTSRPHQCRNEVYQSHVRNYTAALRCTSISRV